MKEYTVSIVTKDELLEDFYDSYFYYDSSHVLSITVSIDDLRLLYSFLDERVKSGDLIIGSIDEYHDLLSLLNPMHSKLDVLQINLSHEQLVLLFKLCKFSEEKLSNILKSDKTRITLSNILKKLDGPKLNSLYLFLVTGVKSGGRFPFADNYISLNFEIYNTKGELWYISFINVSGEPFKYGEHFLFDDKLILIELSYPCRIYIYSLTKRSCIDSFYSHTQHLEQTNHAYFCGSLNNLVGYFVLHDRKSITLFSIREGFVWSKDTFECPCCCTIEYDKVNSAITVTHDASQCRQSLDLHTGDCVS